MLNTGSVYNLLLALIEHTWSCTQQTRYWCWMWVEKIMFWSSCFICIYKNQNCSFKIKTISNRPTFCWFNFENLFQQILQNYNVLALFKSHFSTIIEIQTKPPVYHPNSTPLFLCYMASLSLIRKYKQHWRCFSIAVVSTLNYPVSINDKITNIGILLYYTTLPL